MSNEHEPSGSEAESRRRFLKKAGATAFAGPMIVTLISSSTRALAAPDCGVAVFDVDTQTFGCTGGVACGSGGVCVPNALVIGAQCSCQTP
jgi:hypothetical protein